MLAFGCHYSGERFQNLLFADSTAFVCRIRILVPSERRFDLRAFRLTIALFSLLFLALAELSAQTPPPDATLLANPVFQKNCAKCHGKTAEGRHFGGPSLISEKTVGTPAEDLRNVIANGKGRMPKYAGKLSADEIDALVQQIKSSKPKP